MASNTSKLEEGKKSREGSEGTGEKQKEKWEDEEEIHVSVFKNLPLKENRTQEELPLSQAQTVVNSASFCSNLQIVEWKQN